MSSVARITHRSFVNSISSESEFSGNRPPSPSEVDLHQDVEQSLPSQDSCCRSRLNQYIQSEGKGLNIDYKSISEGPDHKPKWTVIVTCEVNILDLQLEILRCFAVSGEEIVRERGEPGEKKHAVKERAAGLALRYLQEKGIFSLGSPEVEDSIFDHSFKKWLKDKGIPGEYEEINAGLEHEAFWTCGIHWNGVMYGRGSSSKQKAARIKAMKEAACHPDLKSQGCPQPCSSW